MSLETVESKYLDGSARLNCSDETAAMIDDEVKELLKECFEEAKKAFIRKPRCIRRDCKISV